MYERYYSTCQGCAGGWGRSERDVEAGRRERERYKRRRKTERPRRDTEGDGNEGGGTVESRGGQLISQEEGRTSHFIMPPSLPVPVPALVRCIRAGDVSY